MPTIQVACEAAIERGARVRDAFTIAAELSPPPSGAWPDGAIVAIARANGRDHLYRIEPGRLIGEVEMPFTELDALRATPRTIVALAGAPGDPWIVARFDPVTLAPAGVLRRDPHAPDGSAPGAHPAYTAPDRR